MSFEESKKYEEGIKAAFAECFPLAGERDLPWYPNHIPGFLKQRIEFEVDQRTFHFTSRVCRVLCEVTHPKTHVEDMARMVVNQIKEVRAENDRLRERINELVKKYEEPK